MALAAVLAGVQLGTSIYRGVKSAQGLTGMKGERRAEFMDAADPIQENRRLGLAQQARGLSPVATAVAKEGFAQGRAGSYRAATDLSGGQLSNAISRMGASSNAQFGMGLAAQSQAASERGLGMRMGANQQLSSLQQADVRDKQSNYDRRQVAFGQGVQDAIYSGVGALEGYATSKMSMENAEADRQLYRDLNTMPSATEEDYTPPAMLGNPLSLYRKFGTPSQYKTGGLPAFSLGGKPAGLNYKMKTF
jgi:hypothetical protein